MVDIGANLPVRGQAAIFYAQFDREVQQADLPVVGQSEIEDASMVRPKTKPGELLGLGYGRSGHGDVRRAEVARPWGAIGAAVSHFEQVTPYPGRHPTAGTPSLISFRSRAGRSQSATQAKVSSTASAPWRSSTSRSTEGRSSLLGGGGRLLKERDSAAAGEVWACR